jgi:hypothetical protein
MRNEMKARLIATALIGTCGEGLPLLGFVVEALGLGLCLAALMGAQLARQLTCGNRHDLTFREAGLIA